MEKKSLWIATTDFKSHSPLTGDLSTDIVIIGAGLTGILTATLLKNAGFSPIVIEANTVGNGVSGHTTGKITAQHRLIYSDIADNISLNDAKNYALAQRNAISGIKNIIDTKKIDCDYETCSAYAYTLSEKDMDKIKRECELANKCGINAEVANTNLPFETVGAIKFPSQGKFNPAKFMSALANDLEIYEQTSALAIKDRCVITNRGKINANIIVIATNFPFVNFPGLYFARMHADRSYLLAVKNAVQCSDVYIDIDKEGYTFRSYKDYMILGGKSHKTGKNHDYGRYNDLLLRANELYPENTAKYAWSAQDCISTDNMPYIGNFSTGDKNIYVATGFNKWGMTNSYVAADIISSSIANKSTPYKETFSPARFHANADLPSLAENAVEATVGIISEIIAVPYKSVEELPLGHGGIVVKDGEKQGVYKDKDGFVFTVDTKCPHLGCELAFNPEEKSWDCPCHGSRFDYSGKRLCGPATEDLKKL